MVRDVRVKEYIFSQGSLVADGGGEFEVFSDHPINGTIQNIEWQAGNNTSTGSIILFASGLINSGTGLPGQIANISGISVDSITYPSVIPVDIDGVTGSATSNVPRFQHVINTPIRVQGTNTGDDKSGLGLVVRYI